MTRRVISRSATRREVRRMATVGQQDELFVISTRLGLAAVDAAHAGQRGKARRLMSDARRTAEAARSPKVARRALENRVHLEPRRG